MNRVQFIASHVYNVPSVDCLHYPRGLVHVAPDHITSELRGGEIESSYDTHDTLSAGLNKQHIVLYREVFLSSEVINPLEKGYSGPHSE